MRTAEDYRATWDTGGLPAAWNEPPQPVRACLRVVMDEEVAHRCYAVRDPTVLEAR